MNSGIGMLLIFLGCLAVATFVVLSLLKFAIRRLGIGQLIREGAVLTDNGLEYLGFLWLVKHKATYADVESVEITPYFKGYLSFVSYHYGLSPLWRGSRAVSKIVVIKLKTSRSSKCLLCTPKDSSTFVEQLKSRIKLTVIPSKAS
jgi:hypothetical protein